MKVVSKQKEYIAIKVNFSAEFFIQVGKYLREDQYVIKVENDVRQRFTSNELFLKFNDREIKVEKGFYILLDVVDKNIAYVSEDVYKSDYLELKED